MKFYIKLLILIYFIGFSQVSSADILPTNKLIIPQGFTFIKSLVYKSTLAPDTRYLQNLLNMNTATEIKIDRWDNSGSNANLTDNFGRRTRSALERFHTFYNQKIQDEYKKANPNATTTFTPDSSILDFYTRSVMNDLVLKYQKQRDGQISTTTASTTVTKKDDSGDGAILAAIAAIASLSGAGTSGASAAGLIPFGGKSTSMVVCACSGNVLLYITDPRGNVLPLMYQPGATILYKMGNPTAGTNMLGKYVSGGVCLVPGTPCTTGGNPIGTMVQLGTSLSSTGF